MEFRQALAKALAELMREDNKICVLDADLSKPNGTSSLYKEFPDRCFDVGIAEANMVGVAAGLAAYGYKPIVVTMSFEDIATLRSIPTMTIYDAVDDTQVYQAIKQIMNTDGPCYIRMPRKAAQPVYDENYKFALNKADVITKGNDITIVASGIMVAESLKAVLKLKEEGISAELISANTIKPLDEETILNSIKKTNHVVTCENHNVIGGLYSAVSEMLIEKYPLHVDKIAVMDQFGQVGKYSELLSYYHLTSNDKYNVVKKNLNIIFWRNRSGR